MLPISLSASKMVPIHSRRSYGSLVLGPSNQTGCAELDTLAGTSKAGLNRPKPARPRARQSPSEEFALRSGTNLGGLTLVRLFGLPCARAFCLIGMRSLHAAFLEKCPAMAHAGVSGRLLRDGDPTPGVKRINAPILGGANCHTWVANRYTALCSWYRREDDPRR